MRITGTGSFPSANLQNPEPMDLSEDPENRQEELGIKNARFEKVRKEVEAEYQKQKIEYQKHEIEHQNLKTLLLLAETDLMKTIHGKVFDDIKRRGKEKEWAEKDRLRAETKRLRAEEDIKREERYKKSDEKRDAEIAERRKKIAEESERSSLEHEEWMKKRYLQIEELRRNVRAPSPISPVHSSSEGASIIKKAGSREHTFNRDRGAFDKSISSIGETVIISLGRFLYSKVFYIVPSIGITSALWFTGRSIYQMII